MASRLESLIQAHEYLAKNHSADISIDVLRPEIRSSWQRCLQHGLRPNDNPKKIRLTKAEFRNVLDHSERVFHIAKWELKKLQSQMPGENRIFTFADPQAVLLEVILNKPTDDVWPGLVPGGRCDESVCGTNGLGTTAFCRQPLAVQGPEHFFHSAPNNLCAAAPVVDPDGDVVGIIGTSSSQVGLQARRMIELVSMSAANIENELFRERFAADVILQFHRLGELAGSLDAGLIALNDMGEIVSYNNRARLFFADRPFHSGHHFDEIFRLSFRELVANTRRGGSPTSLVDLKGNCFSVGVSRPSSARVHIGTLEEPPSFVCKDSVVAAAISTVKRAVQLSVPILIQGETGTGKELLAAYAHRLSGRRGKFISVNCAAIPEDLVGMELFGYRGGSFTGARPEGSPGLIRSADDGTLFLDEIADMPIKVQPALLRFLDNWTVRSLGSAVEQKVDIQLVVASSCPLEELTAKRKFRLDLLHRISTVEVFLPHSTETRDHDSGRGMLVA
jgi:transcriptional regulator of acetoin/glycerol metabolism